MDVLYALRNALGTFLAFLPQLVFFLVILIVGFVLAKVLTKVLAKLLQKVGFNKLVERGGLKIDAATVASKIIFYTLMLFVLSAAFGVFGPTNPVSAFLRAVIAYLPLVFVAIVIVVIAAAIAAAAKGLIQNSLGALSYGKVLANIVSGLILAFGVIAALNQLGIAANVVNAVLYAFLAALVGIAIVAVGGGGIKTMSQRWEQTAARYDEEKPKLAQHIANAPSVADQARQAKQAAQSTNGPAPASDGLSPAGAHRP